LLTKALAKIIHSKWLMRPRLDAGQGGVSSAEVVCPTSSHVTRSTQGAGALWAPRSRRAPSASRACAHCPSTRVHESLRGIYGC
jgi:hypothetical protein